MGARWLRAAFLVAVVDASISDVALPLPQIFPSSGKRDPRGGSSGFEMETATYPVLNKHNEPSCEQLRAMWRASKRQSRAAEMTNEIPKLRDPFVYPLHSYSRYFPFGQQSYSRSASFNVLDTHPTGDFNANLSCFFPQVRLPPSHAVPTPASKRPDGLRRRKDRRGHDRHVEQDIWQQHAVPDRFFGRQFQHPARPCCPGEDAGAVCHGHASKASWNYSQSSRGQARQAEQA